MRHIGGWRRRLVVAALATLAAAAPASADTTTIEFDDLPDGTFVTGQYADAEGPGSGVRFAPADVPGSVPGSSVQPRIRDTGYAATAPNVLDTSSCGGEFCANPVVVAKLSHPRGFVSVRPGIWADDADSRVRLTVYDSEGTKLSHSFAFVSSRTGPYCNFGCELRVDAPGIRYFAITRDRPEDNPRIGIDSLSFERTPAPTTPSYSLLWTGRVDGGAVRFPAVGLRPGYSTSTEILVDRLGGSSGALQFYAGVPAGVTASFSPETTTGSQTTLTLTASPGVPALSERITVGAIAADEAASGPSPQTTAVPLDVRSNFGLPGDRTTSIPAQIIGVPPCTPVTAPVPVFVPSAFASIDGGFIFQRYFGAVDVALTDPQPPVGVTARLGASSVTLSEATHHVDLHVAAGPGALGDDAIIGIGASKSPYNASAGRLVLRPVGGRVATIEPDAGVPPRFLHPGSQVVLTGTGFCPDTTLRIGNDAAVARPTSIDPAGQRLTFRIPRLATSGKITVVSGGRTFVSDGEVVVDSHRNTAGFAFANRSGSVTLDDFIAVFGADQTSNRFTVNLCWPLDCSFTVTVPNGMVEHLLSGNTGRGGMCFGFTLGALRLARGDASLEGLPPRHARVPWELAAPDAPSPEALRFVTREHVRQSAAEVQDIYDRQANLSSHDIRGRIEKELRVGNPPIITIRSGGKGHAVGAYDLEDDPARPGAFYIHTYDPNVPYRAAETSDGALHRARVEASRIHVTPDGRWSFPNLGWSEPVSAMQVVPYGVAARPRPALARAIFGWVLSEAPPGVAVTALTNAAGRSLIDRAGEPTVPDVRRYGSTDASDPAIDAYAFSGPGPYVQTLSGGGGRFVHRVRGAGFVASLEAPARARGALRLVPREAGLGWTPERRRTASARAAGAGPATLAVTAEAGGVRRTATVTTTGGAQLAFDRGRRAVELRQTGGPGTATLTVAGLGGGGAPGTFSTGPLRLAAGETLTLRPDWRAPALRPARLVRRRGSRTSTRRLRNRAGIPAGSRIAALRLRGRGATRSVQVRTTVPALPQGSSLTVAFAVLDGRRVVARGQRSVAAPARGTRTDTFAFRRSGRRALRVVASAVIIRGGPAPRSWTLRRTAAVR